MMKRILATALCFVMVLSMLPVAYAASSTVTIGDNVYLSDDVYYADGTQVYTGNGDQTKYPLDLIEPHTPQLEKPLPQAHKATAEAAGNKVDTIGVPKGSSLTVTEPTDEAQAAVDALVAEQPGTANALFTWDISVQDEDGADWQPEGELVKVDMDIPNADLHPVSEVYVIHVDDEGNAERLEAQVVDEDTVSFYTDGFSTFAGFTVDFEYDGEQFSIRGLESVLLSQLFNELKMPLYVEDVKDVTFTDYDLIALERQADGDWLLTSLEAFQTTETLSVTMVDGTVYDINVTDEQYATVKIGDSYYDGRDAYGDATDSTNGVISWYLDGDVPGIAYFAHAHESSYASYDGDGWSREETIEIIGPGTMVINLQHQKEDSSSYFGGSDCDLRLDLYSIKITGGAEVVFRLGGSFSGEETLTIKGVQAGKEIFNVVDGSLYLRVNKEYDLLPSGDEVTKSLQAVTRNASGDCTSGVPVFIDASVSTTSSGYSPIYADQNAGNVVVEDVEFINSDYRALNARPNDMTNLIFRNCVFANTVHAKDSACKGGAILIQARHTPSGSSSYEVDVNNFELNNCWFEQTTAGDDGGAVYVAGRCPQTTLIKDCTFTKCQARQPDPEGEDYAASGGALAFCGVMGSVEITGCTFTDCMVSNYGGAVYFAATTNPNGNYSRINSITISDTTFTRCLAFEQDGGAISFRSQTNTISVLGCTFTDCVAGNNGGAVAFGHTSMGTHTGFTTNSGFLGTANDTCYDWVTEDSDGNEVHTYRTTIQQVVIDAVKDSSGNIVRQTVIEGCMAQVNGGGILFAHSSCIYDADISNTVIDGCRCVKNGNGIFMSTVIVKYLDITDCEVMNCDNIKTTNEDGTPVTQSYTITTDGSTETFTLYTNTGTYDVAHDSADVAGTIRATGETTCQMLLKDTLIHDNRSHGMGAGLYWNAQNERDVLDKCSAAVEGCEFYNNTAVRDGGAIYCESTLTVTGTKIYNNTAGDEGGGIAQQVYHNTTRMIKDGEQTNLTLDPDTYIYGNSARVGGGISIKANATGSINNKDENGEYMSPEDEGFVQHSVIFRLNGATIYENEALSHGGGLYFLAQTYSYDSNGNYSGYNETDPEINNAEVSSYIKSVTIDEGNIYNNTSGNDTTTGGNGGGIYLESSNNTTLLVSGGHIYSNTAQLGDGGGIFMTGMNALCTITGGTIGGTEEEANTATRSGKEETCGRGGGIALTGGATIEMRLPYERDTDGNIVLDSNGDPVLDTDAESGKILNNIANFQGGGIWVGSATSYTSEDLNYISIANGLVQYNQIVTSSGSSANGGGIYVGKYCTCLMTGGDVSYNTAKSWGGGIYLMDYAIFTMEEADGTTGLISYNNAGSGGGICLQSKGTATISGGQIAYNVATDAGGGIFVRSSSSITVSGGDIIGNTAKNGGGINGYWYALVTVTSGNISGNTATSSGGGVYLNSNADLTLTSGDIKGNTATANGGGVFATGSGVVVSIEGGNVGVEGSPNSAQNGGGISIFSGASVTITGGAINWNVASKNGGGAYVDASTLTLNKVGDTVGTISYNAAQGYGGGGIYARGGSTITINGDVTDNTSSGTNGAGYGGGILLYQGCTALINGNIRNNDAKGFGGGVMAFGGEDVVTSITVNGTISGNTANDGGGVALYNQTSIEVNGGNIRDNYAVCSGGGVIAMSDEALTTDRASVTIKGGSVTGNIANCDLSTGTYSTNNDGKGGGIALQNAVFVLTSSDDGVIGSISGNEAVIGGGIFAEMGSSVTLYGDISENEAKYHQTEENASSVTLGLGGGLCAYDSTVSISGGNIDTNTAQLFGGGAYVEGETASITVSNGSIMNNVVTGRNGGGMLISSNATATITGGNIENNYADNGLGGGIHAFYGGIVNISGGSIKYNRAEKGAGIAAEIAAQITFNAGESDMISNNVATQSGGGIYAEASIVNISGGTITSNEAVYGGGIAVVSEIVEGIGGDKTGLTEASTVTIQGGSITNNYAAQGGGLYAKDTGSVVNVYGGDIVENTAVWSYMETGSDLYGSGGGIYVDAASVTVASATVMALSDDSVSAGHITRNVAARGGGVYVINGGDLTVKGGYVTYNVAYGDLDKVGTSYKKNEASGLLGTGGGIYVADGVSGNASTFTLLTTDGTNDYQVAIYGNIADFAADDVFANGQYTTLNVPLVGDMDLAGYGFAAEGWFEDYAISDPYYYIGLNGLELSSGSDASGVVRYRGAAVSSRVLITEPTGSETFSPNIANKFVCMTLGIPGAVPDTILIDYGLDSGVSVLENDQIGNVATPGVILLGAARPILSEGVDYTENTVASGFVSEYPGKYGKFISDGHTIRYELYDMLVVGYENLSYAVSYNGDYYYAQISVIPATTLYFEDDFDVDYETGRWTQITTGTYGDMQDNDRPGFDINDKLGELDKDNPYGSDSAYSNVVDFSLGSAYMTTVSGTTTSDAYFTFQGTGFDIISMCSNNTGTILVEVTNTATQETTYHMVDTYYGYTFDEENSSWDPTDGTGDGSNAIYQIPVLKVTGLEYAEYSVRIHVAYNEMFDHNNSGTYDFYLDGIRIYDPAGSGVADGDTTILDSWKSDNEAYPQYIELRDHILQVDTSDPFAGLGSDVSGALFIDGINSVGYAGIANYKHYGPNNEIYLAPGQALTFDLQDDANIAGYYLGMKSLGGTVNVKIYDATNAQSSVDATQIESATDMYYDISTLRGKTVVIYNSNTQGAVLSVTNLKTTYVSDTASVDLSPVTVGEDSVNMALASLDVASTVTAPTLTLDHPTLSFESEVRYNVYFSASDLADVVEMGLITFGSKLTDGTIADAKEVIAGYQTDGALCMVSSNGIAARDMGTAMYFKIYAKLSDGSYVYSDVAGYSAVAYANTILNSETSSDTAMALVVALLNYGAEAQSYFGSTDDLMNAGLTEEQQALVMGYDEITISDVITVDESKQGVFVNNGGFDRKYPTVSFDSTFYLNYYFTPSNTVDGEMTLYYWDQENYESVDELTAENASGSITMVKTDSGAYSVSYTDIAAKQIDETLFVSGVYESDGVTYCTGVIGYSLAKYCQTVAENDSSEMQQLAQATAIYGCYAKSYFN